jgi:5S rRNA maturation endonuclease (ribonuclease M5)/ribosomal protein L37AE/L43A
MSIDYVRSKGWEHRLRGDQVNIRVCPVCHDEGWHFFISKDGGLWDCKKCQAKGNLFQLKTQLGDAEEVIHPAVRKTTWAKPNPDDIQAWHEAIFKDYETLRYLNARGITAETIKRFKLGVCEQFSAKNGGRVKCLAIPHRYGSEWVNVKFRSLPPAEKDFLRAPDCRSVLFNSDAIQAHDEIILAEGEVDALTLVQHGFDNAVGVTGGAGSFDADWVRQLEKAKRIYLCYDADEAGQKGAVAVAKRLGYNRCWNVQLPVKDANDFFQKHTADDFHACLKSAKQFQLPGIISVRDAMDLLQGELAEGEEHKGITTPWENVNRIISGWKPGDLIILTALPKTGKTTWALDVTRNLVLGGTPSLFYCLEMRPERLMRKLIQAQYRLENPTLENMRSARPLLEGMPLFFGHAYKFQRPEELMQSLGEAINRYGIKFAVFDNLHLLCRSDRVNEELSRTVLGFKLLAEEAEIPILLIAQPRKRENGATEIMSAEDVKYSSAIHSDCDQMIILHRNRKASKAKDVGKDGFIAQDESLDPVTLVRVEAHRYGPGGETLLYYVGAQSRFALLDTRDSMKVVHSQARGR